MLARMTRPISVPNNPLACTILPRQTVGHQAIYLLLSPAAIAAASRCSHPSQCPHAAHVRTPIRLAIRSHGEPETRFFVITNLYKERVMDSNDLERERVFQAIYATGIKGKAGLSPDNLAEDLGPLLESVIRCIPGPRIDKVGALHMLATNTEYDKHKGRIAIGHLHAGVLQKGMEVRIGETIADKTSGKPLPAIKVEEPTVKMAFSINTSPFVGRGGKYVTSRNLRDRLYRELEQNLAMRVEDSETADTFIVSGRVMMLSRRREGYEFMEGPPKVINKKVDDKLLEPYEIAAVEVPEEHMGAVVELLGKKHGQMIDMEGVGSEGTTLLRYKIPTHGLLGLRNAILTAS
ncbi:hypothetical protein CRYUN_Cryun16bG0078000 [Craigia yunnanensis]